MRYNRDIVSSLPWVRRFFYTEKIAKMLWTFHKTDQDPKPSVPHGHSQDNKYRLSIWDGNVYKKQSGKLQFIGRANTKEMLALYANNDFVNFTTEVRSWYKDSHPYCPALSPFKNEYNSGASFSAQSLAFARKSSDEFSVALSVSLWGYSARKARRHYGSIKFKTNHRSAKRRIFRRYP